MAQYKSSYTGPQIDAAIDTVYNLADVATSGDYDDLINKPSIPSDVVTSVNNKTGDVTLTASDVGALPSNTTYVSDVVDENSVTYVENGVAIIPESVPVWNGNMLVNNDGNNNGFIVEYDDLQLIGAKYNVHSDSYETRIHYIVTPTADGDAANKKYVDDSISGITHPVTDVKVNNTSILSSGVANLVTNTAYDASSNKIATAADVAEIEPFIVHITSNSETEIDGQYYYPTDKTFAQAKAALEAGKTVRLTGYDDKFLGDACYSSTTKIQFMNIQYARGSNRMTYTTYWYDLTSDGVRDSVYSDNVGKSYNTQTISLINTLPTTPGEAGQMIYSDGSRVLKWMDIPVTDIQANGTSIISSGVANIVTNTAYNASTNKIATMSDIPEDKLFLVTATMSGLTTGTSDKSVTEIAAAVAAGKFVYIKTTVGTTTITAPLMHVVDTIDVSKAVFNYDDQQNSSQLYHAVLEITGTTVTVTWTNEKYARESQIPDSTSDLTNDSGFITAATAPVTSVNSQTGDVVLTIPTATSELTNDSGFVTTIPAVTATGVLSFTNLNDVIEITHDTPAASDPEKLVSAVYPITIDSYGHITTAGSAVTIPSEVTESTVSGWGFTKNAGTVTSVTASGALTSSGGATPAITHNAPATSPAKGTQAIYPITIDSYGHILSAGSAVTIPSNVSSFTNDAGYLTLATLPIYNGEVS